MNASRIKRIERRLPIIKNFPIKINIGSGEGIRQSPGFIKLDIDDYGQEIIWDIEEGIPLPDNSCSIVKSQHLIEHLEDPIGFLNECHRVLVEDGLIDLELPSQESDGALALSHLRLYNEWTFKLIDMGKMKDYGVKPWKIVECFTNDRKDLFVKMKPCK